jgi:hypothetical protein
MGNSYRIRTTPGDDKNINLQIDQDFESLEILSLKIRQQDVYTRMCADYGVIAGRVFANKGYGIPNVKISIFIPLREDDEDNPVITSLYPFKNLDDRNEDGYKYNLLPYYAQYPGHTPTGTFPSRVDALTNDTVVELYDKYYKYTVTTNDSGDFLMFGVPVGEQTLVMNLDLSDMGPFSLTPQDLIRMGIASESDFDGVNFKSSTDFSELPQIVVLNKTIEVVPFWGEEDTCQIGITRADFDVTSEKNLDIQPTAVFMGSLMSSNEKSAVKQYNVAKKQTGELCKLITGPGEIIALTQTIFRDENGLPIIERAPLPNGGKLIDGNGTWMFELPMNAEYVTTNEFGQLIISDDPEVGIPTRAKYRFKIKWQQSTSLSEDYKRAYYLVPNIREKGWDLQGIVDPAFLNPTTTQWKQFQSSYAFSLSWSAYTQGPLTMSNPDIASIVNCEDTFYEFEYNKVYTISMFMDNVKLARHREKFIGIKTIEDSSCEDTTNRYPVNDGVLHTPLIWRLFNFLLGLFSILGLILLIVYSLIAFLWKWLKWVLFGLLIYWIGSALIGAATSIVTIGVGLGAVTVIDFGAIIMTILYAALLVLVIYIFTRVLLDYDFKVIKLPLITYPDCDICECNESESVSYDTISADGASGAPETSGLIQSFNGSAYSDKLYDENTFKRTFENFQSDCSDDTNFSFDFNNDSLAIENLLIGNDTRARNPGVGFGVPILQESFSRGSDGEVTAHLYTSDLPFGERINNFNLKNNFYQDWGGQNQIKVQWDSTNQANNNKFHYDNVLVLITQPQFLESYGAGAMFSLVSQTFSMDKNVKSGETNSAGTNSITGTTIYPSQITVSYGNPSTSNRTNNLQQTYALTTYTGQTSDLYKYYADIEYYQIVTGFTLTEYKNIISNSPQVRSLAEIITSKTRIYKIGPRVGCGDCRPSSRYGLHEIYKDIKNIDLIDQNSQIIIIQRGVDPYSPKYPTKIGLGKLLGFTSPDAIEITTELRLNIPIQNSQNNNLILAKHDISNNNTISNSQNLFFPSYFFTPGTKFSGFTTNAHRFYSRLDYSNNNWLIDANNSNTSVQTYSERRIYNSTLDLQVRSSNNVFFSSSNRPEKYEANEFVDGGSFMTVNSYRTNLGCLVSGKDYEAYPATRGPYNFSKIYPSGITTNFSNTTRIVMRSDRLPSGSAIKNFGVGFPNEGFDNTPLFQQNVRLGMVFYTDDSITEVGFSSLNNGSSDLNSGDFFSGNNQYYANVLNTFDCKGMVDLDCYSGDGLNFGVKSECEKGDIVENGCYVFVKKPLVGLFKPKGNNDITNWAEYMLRFRFTYALCQGVVSTVFNNNWINGNLYAFPFKINTYYNRLNQVKKRDYPRGLVVLQEETNNFYYRVSPYVGSQNNNYFVGYNFPDQPGGNKKNIMFPTTIMNLGPKNDFLKYLILNESYYGYNMNKINSTSYKDLDDMINFFSIIRLINQKFLTSLVTLQPLFKMFSRGDLGGSKGYKIDADFAQSSAINSQHGVVAFDSDFYTTGLPNPQVIAAGVGQNFIMMGIFFESTNDDIQSRDYMSPCRIIRYNRFTQSFVYDYIPVKSQVVPHYKWEVLGGGSTIFGIQTNDWYTNTNNNTFYSAPYQSLDRINSPYPIPLTNVLQNSYDYRGYLYDVRRTTQTSGTLIIGLSYIIKNYVPGDDFANVGGINQTGTEFIAIGDTPTNWTNGSILEPEPIYYTGNTLLNPNPALGGAPWYFYFGVTKGETALNRFYTKYIGETVLNEE